MEDWREAREEAAADRQRQGRRPGGPKAAEWREAREEAAADRQRRGRRPGGPKATESKEVMGENFKNYKDKDASDSMMLHLLASTEGCGRPGEHMTALGDTDKLGKETTQDASIATTKFAEEDRLHPLASTKGCGPAAGLIGKKEDTSQPEIHRMKDTGTYRLENPKELTLLHPASTGGSGRPGSNMTKRKNFGELEYMSTSLNT